MKFNKVINETSDKYAGKRAEVENAIRVKKLGADKVSELILSKLNHGKMLIEFMKDETNKIRLVVKFDSDISWLLNKGKEIKPTYFESVNDLYRSIQRSVYSIYEADMKKVYENVFDPQEMKNVFSSIQDFSDDFGNKTASLSFDPSHAKEGEENTNWDMEVIFRRSSQKFKDKVYKITPSISGTRKYGKVVQPNEKEVARDDDELSAFIATL